MRNLFLLAANTLKITFRKKGNIIIFFILPIASVLLSTVIYANAKQQITVGICNKAPSSLLAQDMIEAIQSQDKYNIKLIEEADINTMVADGTVACAITIPDNFDEEIYKMSFKKLNITSVRGIDATGWIQSYLNYYIKNLMDMSKAAEGNKDTFNNIYDGYKKQTLKVDVNLLKDESRDKSATMQSIGFIIMFMLIGATNTSGFILKEKRERTYFRIFSSPVNSRIYIGANILANMIIVIIQAIIIVLAIKHIFKLNTGLTDLQLLIILITFGLVTVSFGILLVAFSKNSYQAGTMSTLVITPTCMLSGCFWQIEFMPGFMQKIANFLPQRWALEAIRQLQGGKTFLQIIPIIGILFAFAVAFFLIGAYKMRNSESVSSFI